MKNHLPLFSNIILRFYFNWVTSLRSTVFTAIATVSLAMGLSASLASTSYAENQTATFAGGCFWCSESDFEKLDGVISATSGYIGGHLKNPSYKQVSAGKTGHTEGIQIIFDSSLTSYESLLEYFWKSIDPIDDGGQFCDRGQQYRSEIFYHSEAQKLAAEKSRQMLAETANLGAPIATKITAASTFYPAEDYHQDYYLKNPVRYNYYRWGCGRDKRLEQLWGKPQE
ncbi:MAG: peptide-methionine (S)-S-oxide reductase MsrA [Porticoccaceae bacterium]|nr:peptide-methionine (S)-S-oxide reductase MsrA [Porticoccaceae bacterium]